MAKYIPKLNMSENDAIGAADTDSVKAEDAVRAPPRSDHLPTSSSAGKRNLHNRTARLALPENVHSGDSDGDEEEEDEDSEEEDGDPLADLPDETEVHTHRFPASTF